MYLLFLIYLVVLSIGAHFVGTEIFGFSNDLSRGSALDIWMTIVIIVLAFIPFVLPGAIQFYREVKAFILSNINMSPVIASIISILVTILFPFVVVFAMLIAMVGAHMLLGWILGVFKK